MILMTVLLGLSQLYYSKSFPGSSPAFAEIRIDGDGNTEYREDPDDRNPLRFQLSAADKTAILDLAGKLDHFSKPLESGLKVANMGVKTFRFDKQEVKFNYSEDPDAKALLDWFERIAETERAFANLQRSAKYDKLGVENALLQMEICWDKKRLVTPQQMLPILDRIAKNESFMHMARTRAAALAENIRAIK